MKAPKRIELGEYIVADPEICHGQVTFKGTRIMVKSVLAMLAKGWTWDQSYSIVTSSALPDLLHPRPRFLHS